MPKVSIIVPNFNHAKYLLRRLDSIFNQTYEDFEVILLDDCSTDFSAEILNEYSKHPKVSHFIVNRGNNLGTFIQWNKGIQLSIGEFIWIAESDDESDPEFLERVVTKIDNDPKIGLVYCQSWNIDESGQKTGNWINHTEEFNTTLFNSDFRYNGAEFVSEFLIHTNVIPNTSAIVFRRSLYDWSGGINSKIKYCGDWYLWMKLAVLSDICFVSDSLNYFRRHKDSVIHRALSTDFSDKFYLQKCDMEMREFFSSWLKEQKSDFNSIIAKNDVYIDRIKIDEALFHIYEGKIIKSYIFSVKHFLLKRDFKILIIPLKRQVVFIYKFFKRIVILIWRGK